MVADLLKSFEYLDQIKAFYVFFDKAPVILYCSIFFDMTADCNIGADKDSVKRLMKYILGYIPVVKEEKR